MVYVSTSRGLAFDHRPSVQSVPLGLFYPESKAHDCLWLWRSEEGAWPLLSGLVVWFVRMCGWVVIDLVWDEEIEVGLLIWRQFCERSWDAVCWLQTLHLTHSQAELWPSFLRFALRGAGAPRVPAWSPACGHWGPRLTHLLPWRVVDLWEETTAESVELYIWNAGVFFFFTVEKI